MIKYVNKNITKVYETKDSRKAVLELLWGDRVEVLNNRKANGRYKINARWARGYFVRAEDLGDEPLLELYFIDVGQGDGVLVVTPDRKHLLIDGGYNRSKQPHGKSAADFIDWKFKVDYNEDKIKLDAMISSHCDADHYGGLWDLLLDRENNELETEETIVDHFYHAGVSWWKTDSKKRFLGKTENGYLVNLLTGITSIRNGLRSSSSLKLQGEWAKFLNKIKSSGAKVSRLSYNPEKGFDYLPGFEEDKETSIKVLGPIENTINGKPGLKDFKNDSQNTNGHSILLRLDYGNAKILLTGDLNKQSQQHIVESLTGNRAELAADVVKACHHGSDDCSYDFLQRVQAAVTIISSGDDESHAHPRPNIVAASGSTGYIIIDDDELKTPLVYSTEISRSLKIGHPTKIKVGNASNIDLDGNETVKVTYKRVRSGAIKPQTLQKPLRKLKVIDGIVYGLVNVRTDGNKILCAIMNEGKRKWECKTFNSRF